MINDMVEKYMMKGGDAKKLLAGYTSYEEKERKLALLYRLLTSGEITHNH